SAESDQGELLFVSSQRTRRDGWFEVIAGKAMPATGRSSCFGYVQTYDSNPNATCSRCSPPRGCSPTSRSPSSPTAAKTDDQRQVRTGQLGPVGGAAGDEARRLVAELVLQALRGGLQLPAHRGGVQYPAQREDLAQQVGGQAVGDQPGETGLQVGQLRGGPLPQERGQRAERAGGGPRCAGTA